MPPGAKFGKDYLQHRILTEFALAVHLGIVVEAADDAGVILRAPLAANTNYKGTAFGGSLFSVATLAGWAWLTRYLSLHDLDADVVIQDAEIHYLAPVRGEFRATLESPPAADIERFRKMLRRAGRGRVRLHVDVHEGRILAARTDGAFAAAAVRKCMGTGP